MLRSRLSLAGPLLLSALTLAACRPSGAQLSFTYTSFDPPAPAGGYVLPYANELA